MDNHILKIKQTAELPEKLEDETEYILRVTGTTDGISRDPNHDGTYTYTYKLGLETAEIETKGGKVIKSKDNKKQSAKLRGQIQLLGLDYDETMVDIRHFLPQILEAIKVFKNDEQGY
jgi:hypothetical protein